jgi:hypothetical protein
MAGNCAGPLGTETNCPVIDKGTTPRTTAWPPGTVSTATQPVHRSRLDEVRQILNVMHADADNAIAIAQSLVGKIPAAEQEQYRADYTDLQFQRFCVEHDTGLRDGDMRTVKTVDEAMRRYADSLVKLEQANLKWNKKIEAASLGAAIEILRGLSIVVGNAQQRVEALPDLLGELKDDLEKAKRAVWGARSQLVLDGLLDAVSIAYPPASALSKIARPLLVAGVHMGVDRALGPGHDTWGDLNVSVGAAIEEIPNITHAIKRFKKYTDTVHKGARIGSRGVALLTTVLDAKELAEAHEEVEKIEREVEAALKELEWLEPLAGRALPQLRALKKALEYAILAKADADAQAVDADREYRRLQALQGN